jgi:hypothetical protein
LDGDDQRGPQIYCDTCHEITNFPYFKSGADTNGDGRYDLTETDVCDACHSPGGTYDGIGDPVIGAKNNWDNGVYTGNNLVTSKEKWCAGCHDEAASVIQSVSSPNVIGDEDANTNYGLGYGFYKTGHGLPPTREYPASGGTASGAGISCGYCHDFSMKHIDGTARTYVYTATEGAPDDYQHGYRLKSIDGRLPLFLPRTGDCADTGVNVTEFRLCFSCHDSTPFTDPNNYETAFRHTGPDFNAHNYHLSIMFQCDYGPVFRSDWRSHGNDSRASCVTCHNIHGSEQLAMVRDGKLVNKDPGLQVVYIKPGVSFDCFNYPSPSDVSRPESTGTIWDKGVGGLCSTCHGSCGLDSVYYRNIPPQITHVQGQIGSNILTVDFSEGVYSNVGATDDLIAGDFDLTDLDNSRTITDATHTAGQNTATLTLSSVLDSTDDLGTDTLAAATLTSIYDAAGAPMDTTPVTIVGPGAGAQTLALHPSGLHSATDCSPVGGLWADILDSNDGDTSYADCYSYYDAGAPQLDTAQFIVDMDDPSGLEGAAIDQLAVRAVVNVTSVTGSGGPSGPLAYLQICYDTGGPSQECSALYDLDGTEGYIEIWVGNTVDPDGYPLDLNDLNNLRVEVSLNAEDCCSTASATAHVTEVYAEVDYSLPTDVDPPTLSDQSPANGATAVATFSNLTFALSDGGSGVDWTTFEIQLAGSKGYSKLYTDADFFVVSKTGFPFSYDVTVNPDVDFGGEEVISITVRVADYAGNALVHPTWSFTTAPAAIPQTLVLHPSGVASDGGYTVVGGAWADVLDTHDGDASHVYYCCSSPGQVFYVDMDDPALSGVVIQDLTVYVYARYVDGGSPTAPPIAGDLDIGYKTGTNTIWQGSATTDTSGNYNLISSNTYNLDSDSGPLDLTDTNNLQIAVKRYTSGSPKLRVTEVYVEIRYNTFASATSGAWSDSATWGGRGVPSASDAVAISAGTTVTVEGSAQSYSLFVEDGGVLAVSAGSSLTVEDQVSNNGILRETRSSVPEGTTTEFLRIKNAAGTATRYYGVDIHPTSGGMDATTVTVSGNQVCPNTAPTALQRCFDIVPTTAQAADITFYYHDAEENGQDAADVWHWDEFISAWELETLDSRDRSGVANNWIKVTGVDAYSPFGGFSGSPTAVGLVRFEATPNAAHIRVEWETATEIDNLGFDLYRSDAPDGEHADGQTIRLNRARIPSQSPGSPVGAVYTWLDEDVESGATYYYKLVNVDIHGQATLHGPVAATFGGPITPPLPENRVYLPVVTREANDELER